MRNKERNSPGESGGGVKETATAQSGGALVHRTDLLDGLRRKISAPSPYLRRSD
jgi:hypothetical protein